MLKAKTENFPPNKSKIQRKMLIQEDWELIFSLGLYLIKILIRRFKLMRHKSKPLYRPYAVP